jgi:hypothetical protein
MTKDILPSSGAESHYWKVVILLYNYKICKTIPIAYHFWRNYGTILISIVNLKNNLQIFLCYNFSFDELLPKKYSYIFISKRYENIHNNIPQRNRALIIIFFITVIISLIIIYSLLFIRHLF